MKKFLFLLFVLPLWAQIDPGWRQLAVENDFEGARTYFENAMADGDDLAQIGWFLTYSGQGPTEELAEAALKILHRDPESDAAEFVFKFMGTYQDCFAGWLEDAANLIEGHHPANPELQALYANHLRALERTRAEKPDFARLAQDAHFVSEWLISDRFGAYPIPDFDRAWPPEKTAYWEKSKPLTSWTGVVLPPLEAGGTGILYAYTEIDNPRDQAVRFRLFSYHNIRVYVDGKLLAERRHLETVDKRVHTFEMNLPAGRHEIVIKTTQTASRNGQFSLQVTAPQAVSFPKPSLPRHPLTGRWPAVREVRVGLVSALEARNEDLAKFALALVAASDKDSESQFKLLSELWEGYPESQLIGHSYSLLLMNVVGFLPAEDQLGAAYQTLSKLVQSSASTLENRLALALLLLRAKQTPQALDILKAVAEANPAYCEAIEALTIVARRESLLDLRQQALALASQMGPNHRWAQKLLLDEARFEGNLEQTRDLLENLGQLLPWEGYLAEWFEMNQNTDAAIADLQKRGEIFPDRDFYPYAISKAYAKRGDLGAQREWLEKTIAINPAHKDALMDLINLDCFEGNEEKAAERLKSYLQFEPADAEFRQRLSHLEGATAFEEFRVDTDAVIAAAKTKPLSEGADSELLLDQLMVRLFPDGSQMRYTHLVRRVLTKDGVDEESELQLPEGLEILQLRTIKADGSVYYPENIQHKSTISLSGVGIGDFIDEEHIEYLPPAYYDRDGLDAEMTFIFQGVDRIYHYSELVLVYPSTLKEKPVLLARNMPSEAEITEKDGFTYVRWLTKDMPPLRVESAMPPPSYLQPIASFYYNTTWEEIRDFYLNAIRLRTGIAYPLAEQIETWRQEGLSKTELAEKVYRELTDRIEPGREFYKDINLVWESRVGSATLLLAAVYQALEIPCDIVFVQPELVRHFLFETPRPDFTYALLRLTLAGKAVWIDPNEAGLPFGYVPADFRGTNGLVLNPEKPLRVPVPRFDDATERIESHYTLFLRETGAAEGSGREKFFGSFAPQLAKRFESLNKPEIRQQVEAGLNKSFPGAAISSVTLTEELPPGEFEVQNEFFHPSLAKFDGGSWEPSFPLPKTPLLERYGSLPVRKTPVFINEPIYNVASMKIRLPDGFSWQGKAVDFKQKSRFGSYQLEIRREGEKELLIERTYHVPAQFVQPDQYQDFLVFCQSLLQNETLKFKAVKATESP